MSSNRSYGPTVAPGVAPPAINTVQTAVAALPATLGAAVTTEQVLMNPGFPTVPLTALIPPGTVLEQRQFEIHASGIAKIGAAGNLTLKLYAGQSATLGNDVVIASTGAVAMTVSVPFLMVARAVFDSVTGKLSGVVKWLVNNVIVAEAAFTSIITGINNAPALGTAAASFLLTGTFSVANAGSGLVVQEFAVNF
jgi:hypothetical protein